MGENDKHGGDAAQYLNRLETTTGIVRTKASEVSHP